jgi:hypothetical protein
LGWHAAFVDLDGLETGQKQSLGLGHQLPLEDADGEYCQSSLPQVNVN